MYMCWEFCIGLDYEAQRSTGFFCVQQAHVWRSGPRNYGLSLRCVLFKSHLI